MSARRLSDCDLLTRGATISHNPRCSASPQQRVAGNAGVSDQLRGALDDVVTHRLLLIGVCILRDGCAITHRSESTVFIRRKPPLLENDVRSGDEEPGSSRIEDPSVPDPFSRDPSSASKESDDLPPKGEKTAIRFHDRDSFRTGMMLLGLVFHAAWFFQPVYFGHTLSDLEANTGFLYFFAWVHQFRMYVFS